MRNSAGDTTEDFYEKTSSLYKNMQKCKFHVSK